MASLIGASGPPKKPTKKQMAETAIKYKMKHGRTLASTGTSPSKETVRAIKKKKEQKKNEIWPWQNATK